MALSKLNTIVEAFVAPNQREKMKKSQNLCEKKGKFHKLRLLLTTHFAEKLAMLENILSAARYHLNVALHAEVTRCLYFRRVKLLIKFSREC